jgi:agmatinase
VVIFVRLVSSSITFLDQIDSAVTPYDKEYVIQQIEDGYKKLLSRSTYSVLGNTSTGEALHPISPDGKSHPRIITLGGDYTIVLSIFHSIYSVYGTISVTPTSWKPSVFGGALSEQAAINHGTYFYWASQGLVRNGSSVASVLFSSPIPVWLE